MLDLRRKTEQGTRKSRETWFSRIAGIFSRSAFSDEGWDELEELLVSADVGVETAATLLQRVRGRVKAEKLSETSQIKEVLKQEMVALLTVRSPDLVAPPKSTPGSTTPMSGNQPRTIEASGVARTGLPEDSSQYDSVPEKESPQVVLVVGVNGSGKTTSIAKLAYNLASQQRRVVLAAADTFRAAAIEQLKHWGEKAGAEVIAHRPGGDPGAVAYDAIQAGYNRQADVIIIDTAGRLHTRFNLMEELKKIKRVIAKQDASAPHQVLLVMDATTGQNGLAQARHFTEAVNVTGIILAKLDGTARGGAVFAICSDLGIPIAYIGTGEGLTDMAPFDAEVFVNAIFA